MAWWRACSDVDGAVARAVAGVAAVAALADGTSSRALVVTSSLQYGFSAAARSIRYPSH
jgi:hypothetical protein